MIFSVGAGALGLYTLVTGQPSATTELGNFITVLSFFGAIPLGLLLLGFMFVKKATDGSYFPNTVFESVGKLVIVPIVVALASSLAIIMVPFLLYRYYQYKKGTETGTVRFIKWAAKGWYVTIPTYVLLVMITLSTLV